MSEQIISDARRDAIAFIQKRGWSDARFANKCGISPSAFSQFKREQYPGDSATLAKSISAFLVLEEERSKTPAEFAFVETAVALQVKDAMIFAERLKKMVLITSPPGAGKSEALWHYVNPATSFVLTCRSTMNTINLLTELAETIKVSTKQNSDVILRRLVQGFTARPKTVIIDEAQHLRARSLDALRHIWDLSKIPIIIIGNDELLLSFSHDGRLQQMRDRLMHWRLQPITFGDAKALISQRFPAMTETQMKEIHRNCISTRSLCDTILALHLFCKTRKIEMPSQEMTKQVAQLKMVA